MEITRIIKKNGPYVETFSPTLYTVADMRQQHELNTRIYLELEEVPDIPGLVLLDLSLILLETQIGQATDWASLLRGLTPVIIESYAVTTFDPDRPTRELLPISVSNITDINMSYTSLKSHTERNIPQFKWRLTDLVLTKQDPRLDINFNQCLCSVNGLINQGVMYNDELYIPDGAQFLHSCQPHHWPDVVLMDFSILGATTFVPFSACTKKYRAPFDYPHAFAQGAVELRLPAGIGLKNKTVLMVLAHTLYFPDQVQAISERSILLHPTKHPIHSSLIRKEAISNKYLPSSDLTQTEATVEEYILTTMYEESHKGAFFVIIDNPNISMCRVPCQVTNQHRNLVIFQQPGILVQRSSGALVDYRTDEFTTQKFIYFNEPLDLYRVDDDFLGAQTGMGSFDCVHQQVLENFAHSTYEMVRLFSRS